MTDFSWYIVCDSVVCNQRKHQNQFEHRKYTAHYSKRNTRLPTYSLGLPWTGKPTPDLLLPTIYKLKKHWNWRKLLGQKFHILMTTTQFPEALWHLYENKTIDKWLSWYGKSKIGRATWIIVLNTIPEASFNLNSIQIGCMNSNIHTVSNS